ncbi:hypothetical protein J5X98_11270 [Leptothermofonsia sichuanensis E412]|uniref:hypothetical protein n=1 Tax=Leptothermofonsia sichuanensis TaxID=2917832 RepID=UPI001CA60706|nr:hypothetical protein [Leptothermofonsia sichuanensis]QZZ22868.1 hypothetical protein J5X98_11270 [Leptothermofonsia sichuanensis E412]
MHKRTRLNHPFLRQDSWTLWEWWVLATVVGGLAGIGIAGVASLIAGYLGTISTVTLLHLVGALEGLALGFTQWLVLRRYVKHVGWWVVATGIGAVIAWLVGLQVSVMLTLIFFDGVVTEATPFALLKAVFFLGAWVGAVLGLAQWFVLRTHVRKGITWVFANALAWGLGLLVAFLGATLTRPGEFTLKTTLIGVATGATTGVVVGAITGIVLVWLLKPRLLKHH